MADVLDLMMAEFDFVSEGAWRARTGVNDGGKGTMTLRVAIRIYMCEHCISFPFLFLIKKFGPHNQD